MSLAILAAAALAGGAVTREETLESDGLKRSYFVEGKAGPDTPVIFMLHGGYGSGSQLRSSLGALPKGYVYVFPDATGRQWNDGRRTGSGAPVKTVDDVKFLTALARKLASEGRIDGDRVFFAGISNGGMMSIRMACDAPLLAKGIAVVGAAMPAGFDCKGAAPLSAVFIHGTEDPLIRDEGGAIGKGGRNAKDRGATLSIGDTLIFFGVSNRCTEKGPAKDAPNPADDGMMTRSFTFEGCDRPLSYVEIVGGGHAWPGAERRRFQERIGGRATEDFDGTALIAEFFKSGLLKFSPPSKGK